jgi:hypothetical protein
MGIRVPVLCVLAVVAVAGCAGLRPGGEPVSQPEIGAVLGALAEGAPAQHGLRGTGEARLTLSGRTIKTTFAAVYARPGWLRADLRPSYGSLGSSLTAQALLDGGCARVYFPERLMEITGCMSDIAEGISGLDPAALVLGLTDASFLEGLDGIVGRRNGGTVFLSGTAGETYITVEIDEGLPAITRIEITRGDADEVMTVTYEGHGWKEGMNVPRTVTLSALEGTTHEVGVEVVYETARSLSSVDRAAHALSVPPGVMEVNWRDLSIWR